MDEFERQHGFDALLIPIVLERTITLIAWLNRRSATEEGRMVVQVICSCSIEQVLVSHLKNTSG